MEDNPDDYSGPSAYLYNKPPEKRDKRSQPYHKQHRKFRRWSLQNRPGVLALNGPTLVGTQRWRWAVPISRPVWDCNVFWESVTLFGVLCCFQVSGRVPLPWPTFDSCKQDLATNTDDILSFLNIDVSHFCSSWGSNFKLWDLSEFSNTFHTHVSWYSPERSSCCLCWLFSYSTAPCGFMLCCFWKCCCVLCVSKKPF